MYASNIPLPIQQVIPGTEHMQPGCQLQREIKNDSCPQGTQTWKRMFISKTNSIHFEIS